jgi:OOP family OmpA-OmpF porin
VKADRLLRRIATVTGSLVALMHTGQAAGEARPSVDVRTWRPSTDPEASLVLEPVATPGPWAEDFGAWFSYAQDPVVTRNGSRLATRPVSHQIGANVTAGVGIGERFALGIDVPFVIWQDGAGSTDASASADGGTVSSGVPSTALGDVSLAGKATLLSDDRKGIHAGLGTAILGCVSFPTGSRASFIGEGAVTASLGLLAEYALGPASLRTSVGFFFRPDWRTWTPEATMGEVTFGDSIPWAVGLVVQPKAIVAAVDEDDRQVWELAAHGAVPAGPVAPLGLGRPGAAALSPAQVAVDDRIALGHGRDAYLVVGVEAGLDSAIGVPAFRAVVSFGWAPRNHDRDGDGIPDDVDQCPDLPEDRDGIQDEDGCPEDDADGDGVLDDQDACPLLPGPASNDPKTNGCPTAHPSPSPSPSPPPPTPDP